MRIQRDEGLSNQVRITPRGSRDHRLWPRIRARSVLRLSCTGWITRYRSILSPSCHRCTHDATSIERLSLTCSCCMHSQDVPLQWPIHQCHSLGSLGPMGHFSRAAPAMESVPLASALPSASFPLASRTSRTVKAAALQAAGLHFTPLPFKGPALTP